MPLAWPMSEVRLNMTISLAGRQTVMSLWARPQYKRVLGEYFTRFFVWSSCPRHAKKRGCSVHGYMHILRCSVWRTASSSSRYWEWNTHAAMLRGVHAKNQGEHWVPTLPNQGRCPLVALRSCQWWYPLRPKAWATCPNSVILLRGYNRESRVILLPLPDPSPKKTIPSLPGRLKRFTCLPNQSLRSLKNAREDFIVPDMEISNFILLRWEPSTSLERGPR